MVADPQRVEPGLLGHSCHVAQLRPTDLSFDLGKLDPHPKRPASGKGAEACDGHPVLAASSAPSPLTDEGARRPASRRARTWSFVAASIHVQAMAVAPRTSASSADGS